MLFSELKNAVNTQIDRMISLSTELFYVDVERDELFELYLNSFPEGTNPVYRKRTVYDCNSCKKFIRDVGHMVAIVNGQMVSIWDILVNGFGQDVAEVLSQTVKFRSIVGVYRHREKTLGCKTHRKTLDSGIIDIYEHFHYELPSRFVSDNIATERSDLLANKEVLERSLKEINLEAGEVVLELIEENQLYRGTEFIGQVQKFVEVRTEFDVLPKNEIDLYLWAKSVELKQFGRFRNTVIGTLLDDISTGTDIETAVKKYETKVAPTNYKRTTALVTQKMIDRAQETITELGIEKSLSRRFAVAKDLTINNVLFADKGIKKKMKKGKKKKGVFADVEPTKTEYDADNIQSVTMDEFVATILPYTDSIEVMVENKHVSNLMSVIAPVNKRSANIMKWYNPFSWSYNGEVTDSIKERVKRAGGNIDAHMRFSLSWDYYDDLDIHVIEPNGNEIYYGNLRSHSSGGFLDVDMNVSPETLEPVENTAWADASRILEGRYRVFVENFNKRDMSASGFEVQMEIDGQTSLFSYDKPLRHNERVQVIEFNYTRSKGLIPVKALPSSTTSKEVWGVETQKWTKVNMVLNSPNHWNGEKTGNKHWFFILDNCLNPDQARGFYNEFLMEELRDHRKTFELLSSKMKTKKTDKQLSGIGFSTSQENYILCKVSGKVDRMVKITFAENMSKRFEEPKVVSSDIGLCEVCKRQVTTIDSRLSCLDGCGNIFHTAHLLESVRITGECPTCKIPITQIQVDKLVQTVKNIW